ncbi:MAG: hypothetical protein KatS3mg108_2689 [Isosphaeraceae bacterium]|jgi:hypothetical protein|nr:MAG: hypothetical protein KatS3mg108_2689 [Isosphaeraceae bacterium]
MPNRSIQLWPLDRPGVAPLPISPRLRGQLIHLCSHEGRPGGAELGPDEFYFAAERVARLLEEGYLELVSPLDTEKMTEVELTEEQEELLEWLRDQGVQHVRVVG